MKNSDRDQMLVHIPLDGKAIGNKKLRKLLHWDEDKYWNVRDALIEDGILTLGKGKGGSVKLTSGEIKETPDEELDTQFEDAEAQLKETTWYPVIEKVLNEKWSKELGLEEFFVEITAKKGTKDGKWTKPDLTVISVSTFNNIPGKFVDVSTYEVKIGETCNVTAVYEALAHRRAANKSNLFIVSPNKMSDDQKTELIEEAARHGIGLITSDTPSDYDTWVFHVDATNALPDNAAIDDFIETQISEANRKKLQKWIK